jgi:hypothetical protein
MSIGKQQIIHIVSEVVIITGISIYFQLKVRNLHSEIERLENKIEQQGQVIQNHEQLLLRIMNNVDSMNNNIFEMRKSLEDKKSNNPPSSIKVNKKDKDKKLQPKLITPPTQTPQLFINPQQQLNKPIFFPNIPQTENIFVMEIKPIEKISKSSHKIEEIIENEDLDKELEKELQELEKEIIVEEDEDEDDEEDEDGRDKEDEDED